MNTQSVLRVVVYVLGAGFLLCLGGIIWLASANPARSIPDILVATPTGILGLLGGILVPRPAGAVETGGQHRADDDWNEHGRTDVLYVLAVVLVAFILLWVVARVL